MLFFCKNICAFSANIFALKSIFLYSQRKNSDAAEKTNQDFVRNNHKRSTNCVFL